MHDVISRVELISTLGSPVPNYIRGPDGTMSYNLGRVMTTLERGLSQPTSSQDY